MSVGQARQTLENLIEDRKVLSRQLAELRNQEQDEDDEPAAKVRSVSLSVCQPVCQAVVRGTMIWKIFIAYRSFFICLVSASLKYKLSLLFREVWKEMDVSATSSPLFSPGDFHCPYDISALIKVHHWNVGRMSWRGFPCTFELCLCSQILYFYVIFGGCVENGPRCWHSKRQEKQVSYFTEKNHHPWTRARTKVCL